MSYTEHCYRSHDGLTLYYRSYGSGGNVIVCLPGLTRNSRDFEGLAEHLSSSWRVISPDFRGRGRSAWDPDPANYQPMTYVKDTWTLLDELGIRRFVALGTSLGGVIAMIMASQSKDRIRALILNDVTPEIPPDAVTRILKYVGRIPAAPDWESAVAQVREASRMILPGMPDDFWLSYTRCSYREDSTGCPAPDMDPAIGDALRRTGTAGLEHWETFKALAIPCLLLRGALSDVLTQDTASRMLLIKPDLKLVTVPDRGHAPLLDEGTSRAAIDEFMESLGGWPGPG